MQAKVMHQSGQKQSPLKKSVIAIVLLLLFFLFLFGFRSNILESSASSSPSRVEFLKSHVRISKVVAQAIKQGKPVVALESTVITHGGLGYPKNLETGKALEEAISRGGAVPATIAIIDGFIRVGLDLDELEFLAKSTSAIKCSKRDLGPAIALKWTGSTTVAATMFAAHVAGISIFATGGLGGVHRGAFGGNAPTLDVSADLTELARTPVLVVCAGVKSILHVGHTLEWLETQGVPVASLNSPGFPQFFSQTSVLNEIPSPLNLENVHQVAAILKVNTDLQVQTGMVLAIPNHNAVPGIEIMVERALHDAEVNGITGKKVTPYVLQRVAVLTKGESTASNIGLLLNNARVAAQVAVEYHKL